MQKLQIPSVVALLVGLVMAILGQRLPLHQNAMEQTTGEYILYITLTVGGVLIALIAAFGMGRASRK